MMLGAGALLLLAAAYGAVYFWRIAPVGAAYKAKALCSAIFVSGRDVDPERVEDVSEDSYRILRLFRARVDRPGKRVTASFFGLRARTAAYRPGLGATLTHGRALPPGPAAPSSVAEPWSGGETPLDALRDVVEDAFAEPDPRRLRRTRAVAVVHEGRLVAEGYAPGFHAGMPLHGWSMTKSVLNALVGILVRDGRLSLDRRSLLPEWSADGRAGISVEDLLRMRSGLRFAEVYSDPIADVTQMLFAVPDAAGFAAGKPLAAPPGTRWSYASGTTNILSRVVRDAVGDAAYPVFPRRALFEPLGMRSAVLEPDAAGTFVFSSFLLATARDWARFGQLYLQDGVWEGRRLLPEGWVRFSATPTPQSPEGRYGAHWWLALPKEMGGGGAAAARLPKDAFFALGHEGQTLSVVPSRGLVVVRLGCSIRVDAWDQAAFLAEILERI